jgi:hypothetical protein
MDNIPPAIHAETEQIIFQNKPAGILCGQIQQKALVNVEARDDNKINNEQKGNVA